MRPPLPRLHAITDERIARRTDLGDIARELAAGGGADLAFHARGHNLTGLEHYELAVRLRPPGSPLGSVCPTVRLFVNDRLDIALAVGADGVQLTPGSLSPEEARRLSARWWIGKSVHDLAEAEAAQAGGADYLLAGPVFPTATHHVDDTQSTLAGLFSSLGRLGLGTMRQVLPFHISTSVFEPPAGRVPRGPIGPNPDRHEPLVSLAGSGESGLDSCRSWRAG